MFNFSSNIFNADMSRYSIKEVETLSGIKAHTLRIWEQRYDILKPKRTDTNIRYYTDEQLRLLLNVSTLNKAGLKISHIADMTPGQMQQEVLKIQGGSSEPDFLLDSLIQAMVDFDEQRFEKTLSNAIIKLGFEDAFGKLVFPFLIRTGVMWQAGSVRVVQEHFISNLIRRKLLAAVDSVCVTPPTHNKTIVLFLPENENHELLLLFTEYVLRKQGHRVIYLGCSLPNSELDFVAQKFNPDYLVTYFTVPTEEQLITKYLNKLRLTMPSCGIIVGGSQTALGTAKLPKGVTRVLNASELLESIV